MMSSDFGQARFFLLCLLFGSSVAFDLKLLLNNQTVDLLNFLIPTVSSENERCRNHSLLYKEELSKFTVWATDMFDASTKFPSGVFIGSIYDTGNFDECIKVHLPENIGFSGQHCMAHFKIRPLNTIAVKRGHVLEYDKYENIFNITTWHKIAKYSQDDSKQTRDEMYFTFCLPSTCTPRDLEQSLENSLEIIRDLLPFSLEVDVNERNCQVERDFTFSRTDLIYMGIIGAFILFGILCTFIHLITKLEGMEQYQIPGKGNDIIKAFSFSHTIKKMATKSKNEDGIECMNGIKVISMFLIIMGHRIMFYISSPLANPVFVEEAYRKIEFNILLNGPVIVDTFFTISGFLACYMILLEINKRKHFVNVGLIYLHRFLRLTPAYAVVLGFYCTIFVQLGDGPFWDERVGVEQERCLMSWWSNLLYINNYVNTDNICMFQSWYLTCDTHFFLFVPFLTYLLWKKPGIGLLVLSFLIGISLLVPFIVIFINEEEPLLLLYMKFLRDPVTNHTFKTIYIPSHMRASSYLIGIAAGYLKFKMRMFELRISTKITYFGWLTCTSVIAVLYWTSFMFYLPNENKDYLFAGLFGSIHHFLWSICMAWCFISVSEGCGSWVAPIFNWRPLILLSRITYTSFLCHGAIQIYSAATTRAPVHTGLFVVASYAAADIVLAYVAGFALSLVFEAPIMALEKIIFRKNFNEKKVPVQNGADQKFPLDAFQDIYIPKITKIHK